MCIRVYGLGLYAAERIWTDESRYVVRQVFNQVQRHAMMEIGSEDDRKRLTIWTKGKNYKHTHTHHLQSIVGGGGQKEKKRKEKKKNQIGIQFDGGTRMLLEEIRAGDKVT